MRKLFLIAIAATLFSLSHVNAAEARLTRHLHMA